MSRALDEETTTSLQNDNPLTIYRNIVNALQPREEPLEIELLGKSHPLPPGTNILVDGNSIAVPKSRLVQAFVIARQRFLKYVRDCPEEKQLDLLDATTIIILMDPEHLTAANARKRIIQSYQKESESNLEAVLKRELLFVDTFLTSRLHRHTKSPTLWGHRRWVFEICQSVRMEIDIQRDLKKVVLIAAERHPRNYYAWSHMRWLVESFGEDGNSKSQLVPIVKDWCLRHPADTSGFSFLLYCLSSSTAFKNELQDEASTSICKEVLDLAVSFKWTHESVWVFLRTLIASGQVVDDQRTDFFKSIDRILVAKPENVQAQSILKAASKWCQEYKRKSSSRSS